MSTKVVEEGKVVTIEYKITTDKGALIESSATRGPLTFVYGKQSLLPGFDAKIKGMKIGEEKSFKLPPEEAFGTIETAPVTTMHRTEFPPNEELKPGKIFKAKDPNTGNDIIIYIVKDLGNEVEVKLLHPLFGKTIQCEVKIIDIKEVV